MIESVLWWHQKPLVLSSISRISRFLSCRAECEGMLRFSAPMAGCEGHDGEMIRYPFWSSQEQRGLQRSSRQASLPSRRTMVPVYDDRPCYSI